MATNCFLKVVMQAMKACWFIFKVPALLAGSDGCFGCACRCGALFLKVLDVWLSAY